MERSVPESHQLYLWKPLLEAEGLSVQQFAEALLALAPEYRALPIRYDEDGTGPNFAIYPAYAGHEDGPLLDDVEPEPLPKGPAVAIVIM